MTKMRWLLAAALGLALVGAGVGAGIAANGFDHDADSATEQQANEHEDAEEPGGAEEPGDTEETADTEESGENENADSDEQLTGSDAERASAAALAYTDAEYGSGGQVTEVEAGDSGAAYGVEVTLSDGRQVEVHLDADLDVVGDEMDDD